jgi:hypothetical protein
MVFCKKNKNYLIIIIKILFIGLSFQETRIEALGFTCLLYESSSELDGYYDRPYGLVGSRCIEVTDNC